VANLWSRLVSAARAAIHTFNELALVPDEGYRWDDYTARLFRYTLFMAYFNNIEYRQSVIRFANVYKKEYDLYKHIRSIYNPVGRQNDVYVSKVYGGSLDLELLAKGAIPIAGGDPSLRDAIRQLWINSNWGTQKSLYVRLGAMQGDVFLKVVDDRQRSKVRLEVVDSRKIKDMVKDETGNLKAVTIEYIKTDAAGKEYVYSETIDKAMFRTFRDGDPYAFFEDVNGTPVSEWANEYGFVPLVHVRHKDVGQVYGAPPFHNSIGKIDELNDAASILNDNIRKAVNIVWFMPGMRKQDLVVAGQLDDGTGTTDPSAQKDKIPMLFGGSSQNPQNPFPMVPNIDIASAAQNVQNIIAEIERDMPELSLHRMREGGNVTAPGVRAGWNDAIERIIEARGNYDDGLMRAQQMVISIGGYRGYPGFERYDLNSYEQGDLEHTIAERPVIDDALSRNEKVTFLMTLPDQPAKARLVLEELSYSEEKIEQIVSELQASQEATTRAGIRGFAEAVFGGESDADATTEDRPMEEIDAPEAEATVA
jgi:hypothetical protein